MKENEQASKPLEPLIGFEITSNLLTYSSLILYLTIGTIVFRFIKDAPPDRTDFVNSIRVFVYFFIAYMKSCFLCSLVFSFITILTVGAEAVGAAFITIMIMPLVSMAFGFVGLVALGYPIAFLLYYIKPKQQLIWSITGAAVGTLSYILYLGSLGEIHKILFLPAIIGFFTGYKYFKAVNKEEGFKPEKEKQKAARPTPKSLLGLVLMVVGGFLTIFATFIALVGERELLIHPNMIGFIGVNILIIFGGYKLRKNNLKPKAINPFDRKI